ncbi:hypothetical protein [Chryseobacterium indologenes]|uniref:Uncharacterized protein n=1 Tax=Chryseobacterium indologenes TaxID=253 RepID=A0A0N0ZWN9_CHRID|nr:hypothetical protein [Chryseobacterium indologenes]KPE50999.1 hypothetical protein AOB46_12480 [Chryseobacterium indologenes]
MQTIVSIPTLENLAFQRLENDNFITGEVDFNPTYGVYTGYLQITPTIYIDFTDSHFCLADEGEKIAEISPELEKAVEKYLQYNYSTSEDESEYDYADMRIKMQKEF